MELRSPAAMLALLRNKSAGQAQMFLSVHGVILNFFRFARHLMRAENYRLLRTRSFKEWSVATGA